MSHYLQFDAIGKSFPGVRALEGISFGVAEGSVHALMGENGAGKSTLLKILSGAYRPDSGRLLLGGVPQAFASTAQALQAGVAVIYQELHLAPDLSVAENLFLGHLPHRLGWIQQDQLLARTAALLHQLGETFSPLTKVRSLSIAQRQMVEIAKALSHDAKVLAFDEPTSSLSAGEVDRLFALIARLKCQGRVILYVSHRMEEIYRTCDAATVFRDGRHVETFPSLQSVTAETLVTRMVGRSIQDIYQYAPRSHGAPALEVQNLSGPGLREPASFQVAKGEVLGFFGLVGAGRTELLKLIYGATRRTAGTLRVAGQEVAIRVPQEAIRAGVMLCPEDRKKEGIIPVGSVQENINLSGRRHFSPLGCLIHEPRERANAASFVQKLRVKTPSLQQPIRNLSGGNQQKAILARWLSEQVKVLLFDEPTRGIDVGAKSEIYALIFELARQGVGVVVVSSELPEVLGIADRIAVMRQGRIAAMLNRDQADEKRVLQLALPVAEESVTVIL